MCYVLKVYLIFLNKAEASGSIQGIQFSATGPAIHHLLFADDSLFTCKALISQVRALLQILNNYGDATGQRINLNKSSITFGSKVRQELQVSIKMLTGIQNKGGAGTYLGLPECFSGSKIQLLDYIFDKLKSRLSGWFDRTLSLGGKEVLLKAVALALHVYAMTCFKLPKNTCTKLTSVLSNFWWNSLENHKKIHWLSWDKLCLSKEKGGLGFKDIQSFNQALLAKQSWRILQYPDCLFAKVMKSRYFEDGEVLTAKLGYQPSYIWRSLLHGRDLLIKGLRIMIGNGKSSSVWCDPWIYDGRLRAPLMKNIFVDLDLKVESLIDFQRRDWNMDKLLELFYPNDIHCITVNKPLVSKDDFWCWMHNKSGDYSAKSGYWFINQFNNHDLIQEADL